MQSMLCKNVHLSYIYCVCATWHAALNINMYLVYTSFTFAHQFDGIDCTKPDNQWLTSTIPTQLKIITARI